MSAKQRRTDKVIIQTRAIQTREKLLQTALKMYTLQGYYATTVDQIAKEAGLSTGVAYRYFKNKKELLLEALTYAFVNIKQLTGVQETSLYDGNLEAALTAFEKIHIQYYDFHEELEGLRHSDKDVAELYDSFYDTAMQQIFEQLPQAIKDDPNAKEKLSLVIALMEHYCHISAKEAVMATKKESSKSKAFELDLTYIRKKILEIAKELC